MLKKFKIIYNLLFLTLIIVVFSSSIETSFLLPKKSKQNVMHWLPQGWAFFTRNPREENVTVYEYRNGKFYEFDIRNGSPTYLMGINRNARVRGYEISQMLSELSKTDYRPGKFDNYPPVNADSVKTITTKNKLSLFRDGIYLIKVFSPVPWAWSKQDQSKYRPTQYALINLKNEL